MAHTATTTTRRRAARIVEENRISIQPEPAKVEIPPAPAAEKAEPPPPAPPAAEPARAATKVEEIKIQALHNGRRFLVDRMQDRTVERLRLLYANTPELRGAAGAAPAAAAGGGGADLAGFDVTPEGAIEAALSGLAIGAGWLLARFKLISRDHFVNIVQTQPPQEMIERLTGMVMTELETRFHISDLPASRPVIIGAETVGDVAKIIRSAGSSATPRAHAANVRDFRPPPPQQPEQPARQAPAAPPKAGREPEPAPAGGNEGIEKHRDVLNLPADLEIVE